MTDIEIANSNTVDGVPEDLQGFSQLIHAPIPHDFVGKLKQVIPAEDTLVRTGGGGEGVRYITGGEVVRRANDIFGPLGWSNEIREQQTVCRVDSEVAKGTTIVTKFYVVTSWCRMRIYVGTAFREDIGHGFTRYKDEKTARENAEKEAATDALKRAFRLYGEALGNCLYNKAYTEKLNRVLVAKK